LKKWWFDCTVVGKVKTAPIQLTQFIIIILPMFVTYFIKPAILAILKNPATTIFLSSKRFIFAFSLVFM
jgi:hypothetical protein